MVLRLRVGRVAPGILALAGCAGPAPGVVLWLPEGAVVEAAEPAFAGACRDFLPGIDARVRAVLGTDNGPPRVRLGLDDCPRNREGYASHSYVAVCEVTERWEQVLTHELVHWHAVRHWDTLPVVLEEGLAQLVTWGLLSGLAIRIEAPDSGVLAEALAMGRRRWRRRATEEHYRAGAWLVAAIGSRRLRAMAREARARGKGLLSLAGRLPPEPHEPVLVRFSHGFGDPRAGERARPNPP